MNNTSLTIIMYHYVRDLARSRYPAVKGLDAALFRRQLEYLQANYAIVRMEEVLAAIDDIHARPPCGSTGSGNGTGGSTCTGSAAGLPENAALLTFDDGYIEHYTTVFPLLDKSGLQGSFFPPSMILETRCLLDVNKIHFILAAGDSRSIYESVIKEIDFHRGAEYDIPGTQELIGTYAKPGRLDSAEVMFIKRMLQAALPERLRAVITDKLFKQTVGVDESVFAKELYCDADQLLTMKRHGMYIGLHGAGHYHLGTLEKDEYERDIEHALGYMSSIRLVDKNEWVMNYPYGSHSGGVVEYIRSKKCALGLTIEARAADLAKDDRLLLPRLDTNCFPPAGSMNREV